MKQFCLFPSSRSNAAMEGRGEGVQQRALLVLAGLGTGQEPPVLFIE